MINTPESLCYFFGWDETKETNAKLYVRIMKPRSSEWQELQRDYDNEIGKYYQYSVIIYRLYIFSILIKNILQLKKILVSNFNLIISTLLVVVTQFLKSLQ